MSERAIGCMALMPARVGLGCVLALAMAPAARAAVSLRATVASEPELSAAGPDVPSPLSVPPPQAKSPAGKTLTASLRSPRRTASRDLASLSSDPAIMTFASASAGTAVCVGSEESLSDCSYSEVTPEPGGGSALVAVSGGNVITAFGSSSGLVDCLIVASGTGRCWANSSWPVAEGSGLSAVALPNGNVVVTFSSSSSGVADCEIQGTQPAETANLPAQGEFIKCGATGWPAVANTSPSAVAESSGNVLVTFNSPNQGAANCLLVNGLPYTCNANAGWSLAEKSSPSAVYLPSGNVVMTFVTAANGVSDCELSANGGVIGCGATGWPVSSDTSPSAVAESGGNVLVTFNSPNEGAADCLIVNGLPYSCAPSTWPIAANSSPSAVLLPSGEVIVTFSTPSNGVADCELNANGGPLDCGGTGWKVNANSSPSAVVLADGHVIVAFNGDEAAVGASDCLIYRTPVNCWSSGVSVAGNESPKAVATPSTFTGALPFPSSAALPGKSIYNWVEQNCEGAAHDCFATDTDPAAGPFGDAKRYDVATALPTTDAGTSEQFGAPGITCSTHSTGPCNEPSAGEDALAGANDPANNLNLKEMAQVTQQSNGTWEFNLGTKEPEDCHSGVYAGNCNVMYAAFPERDSRKHEAEPWGETFGGNANSVMLVFSTRQTVASANGLFHGFLCVQLQNVTNGLQIEDCGETWSDAWPSPRPNNPGQADCQGEPAKATAGFVISDLGYNNQYATSWLSEDESGAAGGSTYPYGEATYTYSISRSQFTEVVGAMDKGCTQFKEHEASNRNLNNWRVLFFEDGYEGGSGVAGADMKFTVSQVHIYTAYEYVISPPVVATQPPSSVGETSATLHGTVNPEGSNVTNCAFEYGTTTAYGASLPCATLPGGGSSPVEVTAALTGLKAGTTYDYRLTATNANGTETGKNEEFKTASAANHYTQTVDSGNSLNAISCIPASTDCVIADSKGNAFYATNLSAAVAASWAAWKGPGGASEAVECPSTARCMLADGGDLYYATALGGAWSEAYSPSYGVDALSCASASFCVSGQNGEGYFRYATKPASTSWTLEDEGSASMNGVSCVSSTFCAMVSGVGDLYVADTKALIESSSWTATDVDGSSALHSVACPSKTSCLAVDGAGNVLELAVAKGGAATTTKLNIDGSNDLTSIACSGTTSCAAVDSVGNVFVSVNGGSTWVKEDATGTDLTSVACPSTSLCAAVDTTGKVTSFLP
jgi:hypothetical protein